MVHSNASNEIHVRERYDYDSIKALDKSKPLAKTTRANEVALASNGRKELVSIDFTFAKSAQVVHIEAPWKYA